MQTLKISHNRPYIKICSVNFFSLKNCAANINVLIACQWTPALLAFLLASHLSETNLKLLDGIHACGQIAQQITSQFTVVPYRSRNSISTTDMSVEKVLHRVFPKRYLFVFGGRCQSFDFSSRHVGSAAERISSPCSRCEWQVSLFVGGWGRGGGPPFYGLPATHI